MSPASTRMVTRFFSTQPRNDRTPPPPPSLRGSSRELTAGAPELDVLLTVHLQVCKALLQVAEGPRGRGASRERGPAGGPGAVAGGSLCKGLILKVARSMVQGQETLRANETEEVPLQKLGPGLGEMPRGSCAPHALNQELRPFQLQTPNRLDRRENLLAHRTDRPSGGLQTRLEPGFEMSS